MTRSTWLALTWVVLFSTSGCNSDMQPGAGDLVAAADAAADLVAGGDGGRIDQAALPDASGSNDPTPLPDLTSSAPMDLRGADLRVPPPDLTPTLAYLTLTPANGSVVAGATLQLALTGHYSDGSTTVLTATAQWASGDPAVAKVSNANGSKGLATGVSPGTIDVFATSGTLGATTKLTVTMPTVTIASIAVTPANQSLVHPATQKFIATATYSNGAMKDITTAALWASDAPAVATVSNQVGSEGLASTVSAGKALISATLTNVTGSSTLTVTTPTTMASYVGKPCASAAACGTLANTICLTNGWPNGYCSVDCTGNGTGNAPCPSGSTCYQIGPQGMINVWYCVRDCGVTADCPAGYACYFDPSTGKGACFQ